MNFYIFREKLISYGIFSIKHVKHIFPNLPGIYLTRWKQKGYIIKIRNSWYCFPEVLQSPESNFLIANLIYSPSYISHQKALQLYGLIPEFIVDITSITTNKTLTLNTEVGNFKYYSMKSKLFFGYHFSHIKLADNKRQYLIADIEKALLDFLYIYTFYKTEQDMENLRLNEHVLENDVDCDKLYNYLNKFQSRILDKKVKLIRKVYNI